MIGISLKIEAIVHLISIPSVSGRTSELVRSISLHRCKIGECVGLPLSPNVRTMIFATFQYLNQERFPTAFGFSTQFLENNKLDHFCDHVSGIIQFLT
jgi:hypothetical protein